MTEISKRLEMRFGLGTRPELRRQLYTRLERLVASEGEGAYVCIASAAADSAGKLNPGRYFAHVVMLRLQERGVVAVAEV
jgi:hypothetical protein